MAVENVTFKVNVRQNENSYSQAYGKYFAEPDTNEALNLKGFAKHLAEHGKLASYDLLVLVLNNIVSCMSELLAQGQPVKLDGLGTFRPTIDNIKGGAANMDKVRELGPEGLIEGVNICFYPENVKGEKLTSRAFKERCVFEFAYVVKAEKKTIGGKEKTYQSKIPFASYDTATTPADDPTP